MESLNNIKSIDFLKIGVSYFETSSDYYIEICQSIDNTVLNDGFNVYYQTATFKIVSKTGRHVGNCTKKFFINN